MSSPARPATILLAAVVLLAILWSALWLFLSTRAGGAVETWLAAERAAGRLWTCPGRAITGYPFALTLRCERPTFHGEVAGRLATGSLEGLSAGVALDRPRRLTLVPRGPLILSSDSGDFDFTASWNELVLVLDDLGARAPRGRLSAARLAVTLETPEKGDLNLRSGTVTVDAGPSATGPGDVRFALAATAVAFPTLDALPGFEAPTDAAARGVLSRTDLLRVPTRAALEAWREAGGALSLEALEVTKGAFNGTAAGTLALDDAHRPAGTLEAALAGFEPIAQRYGIPLAGVQLGGLLSSLLGGKAPPAAAPGSVHLPLVLRDGRLSVGPFRTGVRLDPLY